MKKLTCESLCRGGSCSNEATHISTSTGLVVCRDCLVVASLIPRIYKFYVKIKSMEHVKEVRGRLPSRTCSRTAWSNILSFTGYRYS